MDKQVFGLFFGIICITVVAGVFAEGKKNYSLIPEPVDVIIPCSEKDRDSLEYCIEGIRQQEEVRRIIVVSKERITKNAEWFPEDRFPFTCRDIACEICQDEAEGAAVISAPGNRMGWIYQQLIKLYSAFVIPGISSNVLLIDADTVFLKKVRFLANRGVPLFNVGDEYHLPYFEHMAKLIPGIHRMIPNNSGITHHMLVQRSILKDLFDTVFCIHHVDFWKAFCRCIEKSEMGKSAASEYEIYFNFVLANTNQYKLRNFFWANSTYPVADKIEELRKKNYVYASFHRYLN